MENEENIESSENLTESEQEIIEDSGVSGEEAHRIGEFDDLRDRLEAMSARLDDISKMIALFVSAGGGVVREDDGETEIDIEEEIPGVDDLDLSI